MIPAALLALAAALVVWPPGRAVVRARLGGVRPALRPRAPASSPRALEDPVALRRRRRLLAAAAGLGGALLVGGVSGPVVGLGLAVAADRMLERAAAGDDRLDAAARKELPVACDLLAVCLEAGLPPGGALAAVAATVRAPLAEPLATVAGLYRLGAEPARAWAEAPGELAALGRVMVRAGQSGSGVQPALRGLAAEGRAAARAATEAEVRRAGVWVLAPLGLCFLPAFVCLGVAPLVLGIARDVFG